MAFKTGSFNILPTIGVMVVCIAGIGMLPYGVRRLLTGEWNTIKDDFERYPQWRALVWDVGAPHTQVRAAGLGVVAVYGLGRGVCVCGVCECVCVCVWTDG